MLADVTEGSVYFSEKKNSQTMKIRVPMITPIPVIRGARDGLDVEKNDVIPPFPDLS